MVVVALGWAPSYREDWLLENLLVFLLVPFFVVIYRRLPLSKISYSALLLYLYLHEVGAHYTYAEVPYDHWFETHLGVGLNELLGWKLNHFDRLVHFLYGVLIVYPVREVFLRVANARGLWAYLLPLLSARTTSSTASVTLWPAASSAVFMA